MTSLSLWSAESIPPNDVCCDRANDPEGCLDYENHDELSFDNCVGAIGVDCDGVPYDLSFEPVGTLSVNLVKPVSNGDTTVVLKTSVGSILHDLCCIENPRGAFCTGTNYPIDETLNLFGNADNSCACIMEWRKAAWNVLRGRYWLESYGKAAFSSDLTASGIYRESWLPTGSGTNYLDYKSNWGLQENQATALLCAPSGTQLDCPSEDNNCKVPCFGLTCKACASGCSSRHRKRWNKNGRDHANAGDSDYCCSGEFKEVYWSSTGTRYGTCK
eukprot:CAMPEP_0113530682 /NCGR_PEP_ID=MMETSP0015_2-20120614/3077_1 /TAXON_ID=2838 /ORGANISM="Odontella" /LENGTH=272 /DNA_ID=CAMNT_0000429435 /DNA_START=93 /DNA_END=911 /DNA_ORIENTATION=+ /assembly_acc=CAM_ASM_000160